MCIHVCVCVRMCVCVCVCVHRYKYLIHDYGVSPSRIFPHHDSAASLVIYMYSFDVENSGQS